MTSENTAAEKQTARSRESVVRGLLLLWVGAGFVYFIVQLSSLNPVLMVVWGVVFAALLVIVNSLHARGKP